jgi:hypothetical protein
MNAVIEQLFNASSAPLTLVFKGVFGVGMLTLIVVGALFFLIGKDYTPAWQGLAAVIGAIVGAASAWRVSKLSSHH